MWLIAMPAAAVRVSTPSLANTRSKCFFTVMGLEPMHAGHHGVEQHDVG
jgi:hypothetical protein